MPNQFGEDIFFTIRERERYVYERNIYGTHKKQFMILDRGATKKK
jgi:hypothetical protein